ncbi:hypothetical protein [Paenibacillus chibensis]|uniref:hypothetical protein n=1 Tax=Paenibacillus chibensis TaxID=59846 RepID=UPI000FDB8D40|nr:hypothetical protein [Paenibacillus chibensis]MEC0372318.1 hypothetical protein [Paenibacillus chibensis]
MKKSFKLGSIILSMVLLLTVFPVSSFAATYYPPGGIVASPGDILITNNTSSSGLTGHAGIVNSNLSVSTIDGYGQHPTTKSLTTWFNSNPNTVVVRYIGSDYSTVNPKAGKWAADYVAQHPNATYGLVNQYKDLNEVYCSKIPWLSFYSYGVNIGNLWPSDIGVIPPYAYINAAQDRKYGLGIAVVYGSWSNLSLKALSVDETDFSQDELLEVPHANIENPNDYVSGN